MNYKIFTTTVILTAVLLSSCSRSLFCTKGEGPIVEKELSINSFNQLVLSGSFDTYITKSETFSVKAKGHENVINELNTNVSGNRWDAKLDRMCFVDFELILFIQIPELNSIELEGSGDAHIDGFFRQNYFDIITQGSGDIICHDTIDAINLNIEIEGSGDVEGTFTCDRIEARTEGSGDMRLYGLTNVQHINITGSGNYMGYGMDSYESYIDILGSGHTQVYASEVLDVEILGSGNVYYKGFPTITSRILGSGNIINKN
jgi:hypothetical protein